MFKLNNILNLSIRRIAYNARRCCVHTAQWRQPSGTDTGIVVRNTLAGNELVPLIVDDVNNVRWYQCGPTVYDVSHVGHARTFVSLDIVQRVLARVFGMRLQTCMNITDVDDKIIRRALESNEDARVLARRFERMFVDDMRALNVQQPLTLTRVTEYLDEIVDYIETILSNGFAYTTDDGSVYFDLHKLLGDSAYASHARLVPKQLQHVLDGNAVEDHDGGSGVGKRHAADFALWKAVERDDAAPAFDTRLGYGRPGWHVECSAMASVTLGDTIDIHGGGIDLKFPHHENEVLQCQAHGGAERQWPHYFLHVGHLHIEGRKMSKSLKNFISIGEFLAENRASLLRWICLMCSYNDRVEWSDALVREAASIASHFERFDAFTSRCRTFWSECEQIGDVSMRASDESVAIDAHLRVASAKCMEHLRTNFDTPKVLHELISLCKETTLRASQVMDSNRNDASALLMVEGVHRFVFELLDAFGIDDIGRRGERQVGDGAVSDEHRRTVDALVAIRERIRHVAQTHRGDDPTIKALRDELFTLSDRIRDVTLPDCGVRVSDTKRGSSWQFETMAERMRRLNENKSID